MILGVAAGNLNVKLGGMLREPAKAELFITTSHSKLSAHFSHGAKCVFKRPFFKL